MCRVLGVVVARWSKVNLLLIGFSGRGENKYGIY